MFVSININSPELIPRHKSENRSAQNVNIGNDDRNLCQGKMMMNSLTDVYCKTSVQ